MTDKVREELVKYAWHHGKLTGSRCYGGAVLSSDTDLLIFWDSIPNKIRHQIVVEEGYIQDTMLVKAVHLETYLDIIIAMNIKTYRRWVFATDSLSGLVSISHSVEITVCANKEVRVSLFKEYLSIGDKASEILHKQEKGAEQ